MQRQSEAAAAQRHGLGVGGQQRAYDGRRRAALACRMERQVTPLAPVACRLGRDLEERGEHVGRQRAVHWQPPRLRVLG